MQSVIGSVDTNVQKVDWIDDAIHASLQKLLRKFGREEYLNDFIAYANTGKIRAEFQKCLDEDEILQRAMDIVFEAQMSAMQDIGLFSEQTKQGDNSTVSDPPVSKSGNLRAGVWRRRKMPVRAKRKAVP